MLQKVISQLNEQNYSLLSMQMKETRADKYLFLLNSYREEKITDQELIRRMKVKPQAFYTLKSRLSFKVQDFLFQNAGETRVELIQNIAKIDHLVYGTGRETSIQILKKLETELIKNDMPNELIVVYKALKKLHQHSRKLYDYSKLYNKCVSYNLAQDRAEDLLSSFCKLLSEYYLCRDEQQLKSLVLFRTEMENQCQLFPSHRLKIFKNILNIHFALFLSGALEIHDEINIEDILKESNEILETFKDDKIYRHLIIVFDFLYFEYYYQLKLHKNAKIYYDKIKDKVEILLLLHHSCFSGHFLISKIEYSILNLPKPGLRDNDDLEEPNIEIVPDFVLFNYQKSYKAFYETRYSDGIHGLNKLLRDINFKNISFFEIEIKLFLALLYLANGDKEPSEFILRNLLRKINEDNDSGKYENIFLFIKLIKTMGKEQSSDRNKKIMLLNSQFKACNFGRYKILEFLKLSENTLLKFK